MSLGLIRAVDASESDCLQRKVSLAAARSYCRHLALSREPAFTVASLLLPRQQLRHWHHVYAYYSWVRALADQGGTRALMELRWWREETLRCYAGQPRHPITLALRETVQAFAIPPKPFLDLLFACEQDQLVKRYRTFAQLLQYCRYAAHPLGHLALYLCRCYDPERARWVDDLCTGLQLTRLWQNLFRDVKRGRIYLPDEHRQRFGYTDADLVARRYTPAFAALMRFEVEQARDLLYRGWPLMDRVPAELGLAIRLCIREGLTALRRFARRRYNAWQLPSASGAVSQAALLTRALLGRCRLALARAWNT